MTQPPEEVIFNALDALDPKGNGLTPWQATLAALDVLLVHGYRVVPADSTVLTAEEGEAVFAVLNQPDIPTDAEPVRERLRVRLLESGGQP